MKQESLREQVARARANRKRYMLDFARQTKDNRERAQEIEKIFELQGKVLREARRRKPKLLG